MRCVEFREISNDMSDNRFQVIGAWAQSRLLR